MTYHPLTNDTGGTAEDRREEANDILSIMVEADLDIGGCTLAESQFLEDMLEDQEMPISPKQLFWLRDIKDKYL